MLRLDHGRTNLRMIKKYLRHFMKYAINVKRDSISDIMKIRKHYIIPTNFVEQTNFVFQQILSINTKFVVKVKEVEGLPQALVADR